MGAKGYGEPADVEEVMFIILLDEEERFRRQTMSKLHREMDTIHLANQVYWKQQDHYSRQANAEYQHRKDRLEEIRTELDRLYVHPGKHTED